jgi:hypothetical protein
MQASYAHFIYIVSDQVDRSVKMLQIMAAVRWEDEDSHTILLALLFCLYGQMQIVVV